MEENKEQAERCRDLGASALRRGDFPRAARMLQKSLQLYPLPGVDALLSHAKAKLAEENNAASSTNGGSHGRSNSSRPAATAPATSASATGTAAPSTNGTNNGRAYTEEQVKVVREILRNKEGGRGAHYRVLRLTENATENEIKRAYRKLSLKVHPDKNSAPHAEEAFKAVSLAYATLSDSQKRTIYDRYGDEDPDNRGGGMRAGGVHMRPGQDLSPEDIFNAFFGGGGMPGGMGGPGFHVYSTGFGPGMHFRAGGPGMRQRAQQQQQNGNPGLGLLIQMLPILLIMLVSFFNYSADSGFHPMPGENKYFSLTVSLPETMDFRETPGRSEQYSQLTLFLPQTQNKPPFTNPLFTRLTQVKEIPYFVTDKFLRTYYRDRYQLSQVERMVERAYEHYLVNACQHQQEVKKKKYRQARAEKDEEKQATRLKLAEEYELSRCAELADLFPDRQQQRSRGR
jgi:DnaJ-domain-containing protein 1